MYINYLFKLTVSIFLVSFLIACSGDKDSNTETPVQTSVAILADSTVYVAKNAAVGKDIGNVEIVSTGNSAITSIVLSGIGNENFNVATDGTITIRNGASLDYKAVYYLTAIATNAVGDSQGVAVDITVFDTTYPMEIAKLKASDPGTDDQFGLRASVDGDYIIVGAEYEDTTANDAGSAYLYKEKSDGSIIQIAKIQADDADINDSFGFPVAISGDYIVISASKEDTNGTDAGSVYLFKRNSDNTDDVTQIAKLQSSDITAGDRFGSSIGIDGNYVVVGSYKKDSYTGRAYLFKIDPNDDSITETAILTANNTYTFGFHLAIDGSYITVGSPGDDRAYLFKINTSDDSVSEIAKLTANELKGGEFFGGSVSMSGDYIVIGDRYSEINGTDVGAAYLFKRNSDNTNDVVELARFRSDDIMADDHFGWSVSISNDLIVVSSPYRDDLSGAAYLFKIDTADDSVSQVEKLRVTEDTFQSAFGTYSEINDNTIIVGARRDSASVPISGALYVFEKDVNQVE